MAQRKVKIKECDRCVKPTRAAVTVPFSFNGTDYEIDLCDPHADSMQRDMSAWTRLARELESHRVFSSDERYLWRELLTREDNHRQAVVDTDPDVNWKSPPQFAEWGPTKHALERMVERGFTMQEMMEAAIAPEQAFVADDKPGCRYHHRDRVTVLVNVNNKCVITVMFRHRDEYARFLAEKENVSVSV